MPLQSTELIAQETIIRDTKPSSFLDLPAELRNRIYELVLFHKEGGGIISPVSRFAKPSNPSVSDFGSIALRAGTRYRFTMGRSFTSSAITGQVMDSADGHAQHDKPPWEEQLEAERNHVCTMHCLLQPALTKVCAQVRVVTLPMFYALKKIHFELYNFYGRHESLIDWWRAVGDKNLRLVHQLNVLANGPHCGIMVRYRRSNVGEKLVGEQKGDTPRLSIVKRILGVIEVDGLHVRALEAVVAKLTYVSNPVLKDTRALEGHKY